MTIFTETTNGAVSYKETGSRLLDFFFSVGAGRKDISSVKESFSSALLEDTKVATAILLWARDPRGGAGERKVFRELLLTLSEIDVNLFNKVVSLIPSLGRFDDLRVLFGTQYESLGVSLWKDALDSGNVLAFKWADRKDKPLQRAYGMNEASFRKFLSKGRMGKTVEEMMCRGKWHVIEYGKLPSLAGVRYAKAFRKHDETRYSAFLSDKETKVNTSTLFPHDVYRTLKAGEVDGASKAWDSFPKTLGNASILVMPDVSGSMTCTASGTITCLDISVSLGTYIAQRVEGPFKNKVLTFSAEPSLVDIPNGRLDQVFSFVENIDWGGNTNLQAAMNLILKTAKLWKVSQEQLPKTLLILSDMQFDSADRSNGSFLNTMRKKYEDEGYVLPNVVFWNLNASYRGGVPATKNENGVCLVSGFSPSILKSIIECGDINPKKLMDTAIQKYVDML